LYGVSVVVHQGFVISRLVFAVVLDGMSKDNREVIFKEFFYVDEMVLFSDSWKAVEIRHKNKRELMKKKVWKLM